jgi:HEAT repeat protein
MKIVSISLAGALSILMAACSTLTEKDLTDMQSPNDGVKKEALRKCTRREPFPINLAGRFLNRDIEKKAVTTMLALLRDGKESEDIQLSILTAMGELGKRTGVPVSPLIDKLGDGDPRIRLQAVESLGKIKDKKAVPALIQLLETEANKYPVIWALGEIGDKSALPSLNRLMTSEDKYITYNANKALAKIR